MSARSGLVIGVALKSVDLRPELDPLTGVVTTDPRWAGPSDADDAALESALRLAEAWHAEVLAVSAGPVDVAPVLTRALAAGATRAIRVDLPSGATSAAVGSALAEVFAAAPCAVVVCGAFSLDRGSGSVPAFVAHHLGAAQALGLVGLEPGSEPGEVAGLRRLDAGRREQLVLTSPAVVSVEGSVARLRRASLAATLAADHADIDVVQAPAAGGALTADVPTVLVRTPFRPRARVLVSPHGTTRERILELTDAATARTPPRVVTLDATAAAREILDQLRSWGELDDAAPGA